MLHSLVVIPYYFLGALAMLACLMLACRLLRLKLSLNALVGTAIVLSLGLLIASLALDWIDVADLTAWPMIGLIALSFLATAADVALAKLLPIRFDNELQEL